MSTATAVAEKGTTARDASVRERPILFSAPMVRAILDGTKTQTRRVIVRHGKDDGERITARPDRGFTPDTIARDYPCPYGQPGDRLWVRETFFDHGPLGESPIALDERIEYRATEWDRKGDGDAGGWSPSIHMPRWASRITLELTGVRVERVQDISEADAIAEGCFDEKEHDGSLPSHIYRQLWDSLNAARGYGWDANPFVWVLEFRRVDT